jgi:hypothetical protein
MDESNECPFGSGARLLVDEPRAARLQLRQSGGDVVDAQRDVMEAGAALLDVPRNRRIGRRGLEELKLRLPHRNEVRANALRGHVFRCFYGKTERIAVKGKSGVEIFHRDADVIENGLHHLLTTKARRRTK